MRPERFRRLRDVLSRRQPDLTVLMDRVNKAHNFSAILRSCDAVGVLEAHVVLPGRAVELHHAVSAGTKKWIRIRSHDDVAAAVAHLHEAGMRVVAAHPGPGAADYREIDYTVATALLVGAELDGVSPEGLRLADARVTVPMSGMVRSLNVSVATAILLFEARRQREAAGLYRRPRLDERDFADRLFEWSYPSVARALRASGRAYPPLGPNGELPS
jgi:tRNA (guanosine-2'-O-)-methyltransferase